MFIYQLSFKDGSIYIGKTTRSLQSRLKEHLSMLNKGSHHNYKVQECFIKYGEPIISIIEEVPYTSISTLSDREVYWIKELNSFKQGLNLTVGGEGLGSGEDAPGSKYTLEDYCAVVSFLAETSMTGIEVAEELNLPYSIINNINSGYTHQYLVDIIPELYIKMLAKKGTRSKRVHSEDTYFNILKDLAYTDDTYISIANRYVVHSSIVSGISSGKGYASLKEMYPVEFSIVQSKLGNRARKPIESNGKKYPNLLSPDNKIFEVTNARQFAIEHHLDTSNLSTLLNKKAKSHKGWKLAEA